MYHVTMFARGQRTRALSSDVITLVITSPFLLSNMSYSSNLDYQSPNAQLCSGYIYCHISSRTFCYIVL